jgi:hypothetical protein
VKIAFIAITAGASAYVGALNGSIIAGLTAFAGAGVATLLFDLFPEGDD